jgi:tRNA A-37 threonylcarbamoyl transferase component Bud32
MHQYTFRPSDRKRSYDIISSVPFDKNELSTLLDGIFLPISRESRDYGGRAAISKIVLPQLGNLIIKHYSRGGLLKHLNKGTYLKLTSPYRSQGEFEMLQRVRKCGVNAPEPVAYIVSKGIAYRTWLVTKEIMYHKCLAEISLYDQELAARLTQQVFKQLTCLIEKKILHVDFHPGNVLVDNASNVYIVDFDKAHTVITSQRRLKELYLRRWRRAVIKHDLPEVLSETMCGYLRSSN